MTTNQIVANTPALMTLDMITSVHNGTKVVKNNNKIPRQIMTLDFVRVQYDTSANAIARGVLYLDVPWLSSDQLNDDKVHFNLPILLDGAVVTFTEMNIPIYLSSDIPNNFVMSVRTEDGTLVTSSSGLQRFTAQFSYNSVEG